MNLLTYNRPVALLTILSGLTALGCTLLAAIAVNFHFEVFNNPSLMLTLPGLNMKAGRWSMILDMFGYYMLLLPVIYYLHDWMKNKTAWSNIITFCGLAYVLIGAIGASILAVMWPQLTHNYTTVTPAAQEIVKANFEFINTMVYGGMWNLLEMFFAGIWWFALGILLFRSKHKGIAVITIVTGCFSLLDGFSGIMESAVLHELSLNAYLYLSIVWAFWLGIFIYRKPLQ